MAKISKPEEPLLYNEEPLAFGRTTYSVTQQMTKPTGSPHVRNVAIYIPRQTGVPDISIRIVSSAGSVPLVLFSVKINDNAEGWMQIGIVAQALPPADNAAGFHYCNIEAIGTPAASA